MNILSQYKFTNQIEIKIHNSIDSDFIKDFVKGFKDLIKERDKKGDVFLEEIIPLKFIINRKDIDAEEDFDILFISYLSLLKIDFPNIEIEFHFINFISDKNSEAYLHKLCHHRTHLSINAKSIIFKIFKNGIEYFYNKIFQSVSYIPILNINKSSRQILFSKKKKDNNFNNYLSFISKKLIDSNLINNNDLTYNKIQNVFIDGKGNLTDWNDDDLSALYFMKTFDKLFILKHYINELYSKKSDYQIGKIITSKHDTNKFRKNVHSVLVSNDVFNFSNVEIYFFSLIVQNSELFKIPTNKDEILKKVKPFLNEIELKNIEKYPNSNTTDKTIKNLFIDVYVYNLERMITYTKEVVYGLEELAKNIVEHSNSNNENGYGVISARIYNFNKIKLLKKNIPIDWLNKFENSHKYLDINVVDSGLKNVTDDYAKTILAEQEILKCNVEIDEDFRYKLSSEYQRDYKLLLGYKVNNLFVYEDSLKLLHQINRAKARLGLLIFSQTILIEKNAFASLASNDINVDDNIGYFLFRKEIKDGLQVVDTIPNENYLVLGTNYNFTIPINEKFTYSLEEIKLSNDFSSSSSSVFGELHDFSYGEINDSRYEIKDFSFNENYEFFDKYSKIETLKKQIGKINNNKEIFLIDALKIKNVIENSSDWVRFLASLQFGPDFIKDIIIINIDVELYKEIIDILKIFSNLNDNSRGFWKADRYILNFIPIKNEAENTFWFNSLLYSPTYEEFLKVNSDIGLYHYNLSKLFINEKSGADYSSINSKLFSTSSKLLNFELLIKNEKGLTLFEETLHSMLNIEIQNSHHEN